MITLQNTLSDLRFIICYTIYVPHLKELSQQPELTPEFVEQYASTFISRRDCYPLQLPDGSYRTRYHLLTSDLPMQHIQGKITLGAYALDENSKANWLCLDADTDEQWSQLWHMAQQLQRDGLTLYMELSRRGGHMWLFTPPLTGKSIRQFGLQLLKAHNLEGVELYPKQEVLTTGVGSLVRLPLGIHRKSGKRYHFVTLDGQPLAPSIRQQMGILSNPARIPTRYIQYVLSQIKVETSPPSSYATIKSPAGDTLSERIKRSLTVVEFVSRYVALNEQGRGLCPFHEDHHHSFQVHTGKNFWHCYAGCGGGSLIDFWMTWRETQGQDSSFKATIADLAQILFG